MPLNLNDERVVEKCREYAYSEMHGFFSSDIYSKFWDRYQKRRDAYHRIDRSNKSSYKSKIYLASYWSGVIALDAQFKAAHASDPFIFVDSADDSSIDPEAKEKSLIAHADINYNLEISRFKPKLFDMYYHLGLSGIMVGREIMRSKTTEKKIKRLDIDIYGINNGIKETSHIERQEMSITDDVHPLNFCHEITKSDFIDSRWAGVRYELPVSDLYRMLKSGRGYANGIKKILDSISKEGMKSINISKTSYYTENGEVSSRINNNTIVVWEYSGALNIKGNEYDDTLYMVLMADDQVIWIGKNPYNRHPYWKASCYPHPGTPYCIDPCSSLLPINSMENSTVNQYFDYMNTSLKALYEVNPSKIQGGMLALIKGHANGFVPVENDSIPGKSVVPINIGRQGLPPVTEVMSWIQSFKQEYGPSSNLRGKGAEVKNADTATGISLLADREDTIIQSMQDQIDVGLKDCMMLKLQLNNYMNEPKYANVKYDKESATTRVQYYPWEIADQNYSFKPNREVGDKRAGKYMSFIKLITGIDQMMEKKGLQIPADFLIDMIGDVGQSLGIDGIDERMKQLKTSMQQQIPVINSQNQMMQAMAQAQPQPQGDVNAQLAMA